MGDSDTSFVRRPYYAAFNLGLPSGAGARVGVSIIPELGVEAHAGTALLWQDYGADLVVRPLARLYDVTPTIRLGMAAMQNNLSSWGGPAWLPVPSAAVGVEWRSRGGLVLGGDVGVSVPVTLATDYNPTTAKVAPNVNLSIGYAFDL
jgi:hypothetical protein